MNLTGKLLIAMPGMADPRFARAVVFLCAYSSDGAMGLILNKKAGNMKLAEVFAQLGVAGPSGASDRQVYIGGPVETERGFVLHRDRTRLSADDLQISGGFVLTATQDILEDLGADKGPDPFRFALGYSGWGAGQLDRELAQNGWLTADATAEIVFGAPDDSMWEAALRSIGIDPITLSAASGRA